MEIILLLKEHGRHWDDIYVICPTFEQPAYNSLRDMVTKVYEHVDARTEEDENVFDKLIRKVKKNAEDHRTTLLLVDDCAGEHATNTGRKGGLPKMAANARHWNLSLICITQNLSSMSATVRDNSEGLILFPTMNDDERARFYKERNPFPQRGQLAKVYAHALAPERGFLFQINTTNGVLHFSGLHLFIVKA